MTFIIVSLSPVPILLSFPKILQVRKTTLVEILLGAELWSIVCDKGGRNSMLRKNGLQYCDYAGRGGESEFLYFHKA